MPKKQARLGATFKNASCDTESQAGVALFHRNTINGLDFNIFRINLTDDGKETSNYFIPSIPRKKIVFSKAYLGTI